MPRAEPAHSITILTAIPSKILTKRRTPRSMQNGPQSHIRFRSMPRAETAAERSLRSMTHRCRQSTSLPGQVTPSKAILISKTATAQNTTMPTELRQENITKLTDSRSLRRGAQTPTPSLSINRAAAAARTVQGQPMIQTCRG